MIKMIKPHKFQGIYTDGRKFYTKSIAPGKQVYGERLVKQGKDEFREWDINKSKLGAALAKNASQIGIRPGSKVLYLGAASGTTPSHVSDIISDKSFGNFENGFVFALDFAPRVVRDLVFVAEERKNIAPILADANKPEQVMPRITEVDVVYQDIAQKNQAEIFLKNCKLFLKNGGFGLLAVKSRSIDVAKKPREVFKEVRQKLEEEIVIVDYRELDPFEKDHAMFVCKKK